MNSTPWGIDGKPKVSEKTIERGVSDAAKDMGILNFKFVSPNNRGVPDRIFLYRGISLFIEFKREGKVNLDPLQEVQRRSITSAGFIVLVCDSIQEGITILTNFKAGIDNAYTGKSTSISAPGNKINDNPP